MDLDAAIDGGLLWLDAHWDTFAAQHERAWRSTIRNYYYTLWTLEKALDLGEIARLGERGVAAPHQPRHRGRGSEERIDAVRVDQRGDDDDDAEKAEGLRIGVLPSQG